MAKTDNLVFVCWGAIAWDPLWIDHVVEAIQTSVVPYSDLWCWDIITKTGSPKHPLAQGQHRIPPDQRPIMRRTAHA